MKRRRTRARFGSSSSKHREMSTTRVARAAGLLQRAMNGLAADRPSCTSALDNIVRATFEMGAAHDQAYAIGGDINASGATLLVGRVSHMQTIRDDLLRQFARKCSR